MKEKVWQNRKRKWNGKLGAVFAAAVMLCLAAPGSSQPVLAAAVTVREAATLDAFIDAASELTRKDGVYSENSISSTDPYFLKRLIVKTVGTQVSFAQYGPSEVIHGPDRIYVLQFETSAAAKRACLSLQGRPDIIYAEPDGLDRIDTETVKGSSSAPVSAAASLNTAMAAASKSWGVKTIGADSYAAFTATKTSDTIVVAVVDTGVSPHSFLSGRIVSGRDVVWGDYDPRDFNGHGTHVAGTIVDCTPGLNVKIMPVRVLDGSGAGSHLNVANGIRWAADHGAKVINLSLGGAHNNLKDEACAYAVSKGVVIVNSAGNENEDTAGVCPGHLDELVVVGSVGQDLKRVDDPYEGSNYGRSLDVMAPGVDILSCSYEGGFVKMTGTSMAAPHVSAVAAMFRLTHPSYSPAQIEALIKVNCRDIGPAGRDNYNGYGIPNLEPISRIPVTQVNLKAYALVLSVGGKYQMSAAVLPANAADRKVSWKSLNAGVATVSSGGLITAKKAGTAAIIASAGGKTARCLVTVRSAYVPVTGVTLNSYGLALRPGYSYQLSAAALPGNATDPEITWKSLNAGVATVNPKGVVTARKTGEAAIIATAGDKKARCLVRVLEPFAISPNTVSIHEGESTTLTATGVSGSITWKSLNAPVATVDARGRVTGHEAGTATILAAWGNITARCTVTVKSNSASVISQYNAYLKAQTKAEYYQTDPSVWFALAYLSNDNIPDLIVSTGDRFRTDVFINGTKAEWYGQVIYPHTRNDNFYIYPRRMAMSVVNAKGSERSVYQLFGAPGSYGIGLKLFTLDFGSGTPDGFYFADDYDKNEQQELTQREYLTYLAAMTSGVHPEHVLFLANTAENRDRHL